MMVNRLILILSRIIDDSGEALYNGEQDRLMIGEQD